MLLLLFLLLFLLNFRWFFKIFFQVIRYKNIKNIKKAFKKFYFILNLFSYKQTHRERERKKEKNFNLLRFKYYKKQRENLFCQPWNEMKMISFYFYSNLGRFQFYLVIILLNLIYNTRYFCEIFGRPAFNKKKNFLKPNYIVLKNFSEYFIFIFHHIKFRFNSVFYLILI